MARPTKLTPELIEKAKGYLATCTDVPFFTDKGAVTYVNVELPSVVGLAIYLEIDKTTVYDWCKGADLDTLDLNDIYHQFSHIVKEITSEQEKRLINNGLGGLYQPKIVGMILSKHGYAEKSETDITSKGDKIQGGTILPEVIAEADRLLKEKKLNG